jgi:hypothetical protein
MSMATRHVESDPLAALRAELVGAARRQLRRRRRRRRTLVATGAILGLLAATAGAGALTGFSTGVPVVDELLAVEGGSLVGEPGPGGATEPLPVPTYGGGTAQAVAYLSKDGTVCHVQAERHPSIEGSVRGGGGGCWLAADLARRLDRRGIQWSGSSHGTDMRVFGGYADGDVVDIRVLGEAAGAEVRMTKPWRPRIAGGEPLRLFVVIDRRYIEPITHAHPTIEVIYRDGSRRRIDSAW